LEVGENLLPGNVGRDIVGMNRIERRKEQSAVNRDSGERGEFICVAIHGDPFNTVDFTPSVQFKHLIGYM